MDAYLCTMQRRASIVLCQHAINEAHVGVDLRGFDLITSLCHPSFAWFVNYQSSDIRINLFIVNVASK